MRDLGCPAFPDETKASPCGLLDLTPAIVWATDSAARCSYLSPAFYRLTGLAPTRPMADWLAALHPADRPREEPRLERRPDQKPRSYRSEYRLRAADGEYRDILSLGEPRIGRDAAYLGHVGALLDVTELRREQDLTREREPRLRLALQAGQMGAWDWRPGSSEAAWSPEHFHLLGHEVDAVTPGYEAWLARVHPEDRARAEQVVAEALDSGAFAMEYRIIRTDGDLRWMRGMGAVQADGRLTGVIMDITQQKLAEQALAETQDRLLKSSRLSAMGAMASTLAHELNQPLTAMLSNLQVAQRLTRGASEHGQMMAEIIQECVEQAMRAGDTIRRIRRFAVDGQLCLEETSVQAIIDGAVADLHRRSPQSKPIKIVSAAPPGLSLRLDQIQIEHVLSNLLRNAATACERVDDATIEITVEPRPGSVEIRVADNGQGLPRQMLDPFQPFATSGADGSGLGLAICRTIVEAHGGCISLCVRPERGAVALISLSSN